MQNSFEREYLCPPVSVLKIPEIKEKTLSEFLSSWLFRPFPNGLNPYQL